MRFLNRYCKFAIWSATAVLGLLLVNSACAFDINGTVTYPGGTSKRVYISTYTSNGTLGTSVESIGPGGSAMFTIRGVPTGTYYLEAYLDTTGTGDKHSFDPSGEVRTSISNANLYGVDIRLAAPPPTPPESPDDVWITAGDRVVAVSIGTSYNNGEAADSYSLYWSTDPEVSPSHTIGGGSRTVPTIGKSPTLFIKGLQNGQNLYFVATARIGAQESAATPVFGPVTVGAPLGGNSVSGRVSYSGSSGGDVYVVVYSEDKTYFSLYQNPTFPLNYTVAGIPDGYYGVEVGQDTNKNGIVADSGDLNPWDSASVKHVAISGTSVSGIDLELLDVDAKAVAEIDNDKYTSYSTYLKIYALRKKPVMITLTSGPGINGPIDLAYGYYEFSGTERPTPGGTYTFDVRYSDGSSGRLFAPITAVLDVLAIPYAPTGAITSTTPTFSWTAVSSPGADLWYELEVHGPEDWQLMFIPGSRYSVPYNYDGSAFKPVLSGGRYTWFITTYDRYGNSSTGERATFTVPPSLAVALLGEGRGSVHSAPSGIACASGSSSGCTASFPLDSYVTLTAASDANSIFKGWGGACNHLSNVCNVNLYEGKTVTATFEKVPLVKLLGTTPKYFDSISLACEEAPPGGVVQIRAGTFVEGLIIDRPVFAYLKGGMDAQFMSAIGETKVRGKVVIRRGGISVDRIAVY